MKIHQLPAGARFEFEGEEYVKTGPLIGTRSDGRQRLIPRHAVLRPLDAVVAAPEPKKAALARADVLAAFEAFCADCARLVGEEEQAALSAARERFLKALD